MTYPPTGSGEPQNPGDQPQYGGQPQYGDPAQYGQPTPPPGGYNSPPPSGSYPPPSYGAGQQPPPYPSPATGIPTPTTLDLGEALSYGWNKYKANALNWILFAVISYLILGLITAAINGFSSSPSLGQNIVSSLVSGILGVLIQAGFTRGALDELDGRKPALGDFVKWNNLTAVFIAAILVWLITTVGYFLLVIPGLIATFLLWYTIAFVIDRNLAPGDALKASFDLTSKNVGSLLLLAVVVVLLNIVGALLCLVGLLVSGPVTLIASTYAYRVLSGGAVSPAQ
ncbi:putative membrane protein [Gordonia sp. NB41Y]|uniref:putative membrane protein n=1 Tax=Gordonia sp. NB41Y TaxID=875808 RepID=UPI0002BEC14A|nr:putative membrane protein [Gordonia sp. NB41Y]EMP12674.1 proline rich protein [Gordonia sp. NB41Y]WLP92155.1 hypothetical protein Q9K23_07970 [Gordonia sp. NB41Y]